METNNTTFEKELENSGYLVYTNVGVSMLPLIRENRDVLIIKKARPDALRKYDVVLFKRNHVHGRGEYVLHRILRILPDGKLFIVGDHDTSGEIVEAQQILGVLASIRRGDTPINLSGFRYKLYVYLWCAPYRLRFLVLRAKNLVKYVVSGVIQKLKMAGKT